MIPSTSTNTTQFYMALHQYLQIKKMTFDTFIRHLKLTKGDRISWREFTNILIRMMTTLKIESVQAQDLLSQFQSKSMAIDLQQFKDRYFNTMGQTRSQSKNIEGSQKSLPMSLNGLNQTLERLNFSQQNQGQLKKAESGLEYIFNSGTVKERLKKSLLDNGGNFKVSIDKLQQFLGSCKVKQLGSSSVRKKIVDKMVLLLSAKHSGSFEGTFYKQVLQIAMGLQERTQSKTFLKIQKKESKPSQDSPLKPLLLTSREVQTRRLQNFCLSFQEYQKKMALRIKQSGVISLPSSRKGDFRIQTQQPLHDETYSFLRTQQLLLEEHQTIIKKKYEQQEIKQAKESKRRKRFLDVDAKCKELIDSYRNKSIESSLRQTSQRNSTKVQKVFNRVNCLNTSRTKYRKSKIQQSQTKMRNTCLSNRQSNTLAGSTLSNQNQCVFNFNEIAKFRKQYPKTYQYFRPWRVPTEEELPFVVQLEGLLRREAIYHDNYNPPTKYEYMRPNKLLNTLIYQVFERSGVTYHANRTRQENQSNPYFMSAISSLKEQDPEYIQQMFLFTANPARYYCVKVYIDGEETIVKTDDQFPSSKNRPVFAYPSTNEIWTMLLQKAYAKVYNGYSNILHGSLDEVFSFLTGLPVQSYRHGSCEDIARVLWQAKENRNLIVGCTPKVTSLAKQKLRIDKDIMTFPCHSVLDIRGDGHCQGVLKVRNPQGYNYAGLEDSTGQKIGQLFNESMNTVRQNIQNGCFYLTLQQFESVFASSHICRFRPNYKFSGFKLQHKPSFLRSVFYINIRIKASGRYFISIVQPSTRRLQILYPNQVHRYARCMMTISDEHNKLIKSCHLQTHSQNSQRCSTEIQLIQKIYLLHVLLQSETAFWKDSQLTCYGPEKVYFDIVGRNQEELQ